MSSMERMKAVRLRLPEAIAKLKFRNEKFDCDDTNQYYTFRATSDQIKKTLKGLLVCIS